MLVQKLEQLVNEIRQRKNKYEFIEIQQAEKENAMPMGKGTYGSKRGRPPKKKMGNGSGLTAKQKTLPIALQKKIMKAKKKKK